MQYSSHYYRLLYIFFDFLNNRPLNEDYNFGYENKDPVKPLEDLKIAWFLLWKLSINSEI